MLYLLGMLKFNVKLSNLRFLESIFVFIFYIKFSESRFSNGRIPMNSLIELERYVVLHNFLAKTALF